MKHLKVKAILNGNKANIIFLEQSHFKKDFGNADGGYGTRSFTHEGFTLCSAVCPCDGGTNLLWVCGNASQLGDGVDTLVSAKTWPKIKAAVEAYNEWGATQ